VISHAGGKVGAPKKATNHFSLITNHRIPRAGGIRTHDLFEPECKEFSEFLSDSLILLSAVSRRFEFS
jgi:hypothetical protein